MTEGEIEHRLTVLSEQCGHNQSRLDDVKRRQNLVPIEFGGTMEKT